MKVFSKACPVVYSSNSLKMSVWFAIISKKILFCSTVWKKLSESVSIIWDEPWKECLLLFGSNSLMRSVLVDVNSKKVIIFWQFQYLAVWTLDKGVTFYKNPLKMSILFDMKPEKSVIVWSGLRKKCVVLFCNNSENVNIVRYKVSKNCLLFCGSSSLKMSV